MLDVARHFQPVSAIKRTLDGMAAVKLNVLHLHLSDDHGFRVGSNRFPNLHLLASEGRYYTQDDIHDIVRYAVERGIRVVPEFDMPGHASSFLVAYPQLGSRPGPYRLARAPGIYDGILDPSNEKTYEFIEAFIDEMAALFPDICWHFGGDEVPPQVWEGNKDIRKFMTRTSIVDSLGLQALFNQMIVEIIGQHGKQSVGWEEILHPDINSRVLIQHWKNEASLDLELAANHSNLISRGYYLDHLLPTEYHYLKDPAILDGKLLPGKLRDRIIGGEAAMWSESVNKENLDIRLWPRLAAIAERFWSPQQVRDTADMYRRLAITEQRLHDQGLNHRRALQTYLASLTEGTLSPELEVLASITTPVAFNNYMSWRGMAIMMLPKWLTKYLDPPDLKTFSNMIPVDPLAARHFDALVNKFVENPQQRELAAKIHTTLDNWSNIHRVLKPTFASYAQLENLEPLAEAVTEVANVGLLALGTLENDESIPPADLKKGLKLLQSLAPFNAVAFEEELRERTFSWKPLILKQTDIAVVPAVEKLVKTALDEVL